MDTDDVSKQFIDLHVDHISDLVHLHAADERVPPAWREPAALAVQSATEHKSRGNVAMGLGRSWDAIAEYTRALSCPASDEEVEIIRRNRALAYLKTKHFDYALADTGYPKLSGASTEKALFRAAEALYSLERFEECSRIVGLLCEAYPKNSRAKEIEARVTLRVREQETGVYNFKVMEKEAARSNPPKLDHASFTGPVEIKMTQSSGRGLFLTKSVKVGDLLLCEKAFAFTQAGEEGCSNILMHLEDNQATTGTETNLITSIVHKLRRNPSTLSKFEDLYHGSYTPIAEQPPSSDPVVDTFLVEAIVSLNSFGCPRISSLVKHKHQLTTPQRSKPRSHSSGIWTLACYINHSCISNVRRAFIGDFMIVRATRDLPAGTELLFWYNSPFNVTADKHHRKLAQWSFVCHCALCNAERHTTAAQRDRRIVIKKQLASLLNTDSSNTDDDYYSYGLDQPNVSSPTSLPNAKATSQAETLMRKLAGTYTHDALQAPHVEVWDPAYTLLMVCAHQQKPRKCIEWSVTGLQALGFEVQGGQDGDGGAVFAVMRWGLVVDQLVATFALMAQSFAALAEEKSARRCVEYAKLMMRIVVGDDAAFKELYGLDHLI